MEVLPSIVSYQERLRMAGIQGQLTIGPSRASRRGPRSSSIIYDIVLLLAGIPPAGALPCAAKAK